MIMYLTFARTASAILCGIATIRTIIFCYYAYKNMKPNWILLIVFEVAFLIATILTWQDALDLLPMLALLIASYVSWQDNTIILRCGYIVNSILNLIFRIIIGAHIAIIADIITLISEIIALIYYEILKKQEPILHQIFHKNYVKNEKIINAENNANHAN